MIFFLFFSYSNTSKDTKYIVISKHFLFLELKKNIPNQKSTSVNHAVEITISAKMTWIIGHFIGAYLVWITSSSYFANRRIWANRRNWTLNWGVNWMEKIIITDLDENLVNIVKYENDAGN